MSSLAGDFWAEPGWFFALCAGRALMILGLAWVAAGLLRRRSASLRHVLLGVAMVAVLLLPVVSSLVPAIELPLFSATAPVHQVPVMYSKTADGHVAMRTGAASPDAVAPVSGQNEPIAERAPQTTWFLLLLSIWIAGAGFVFAPVAVGLFALRRRARRAHDVTSPASLAILEEIRVRLRIRRVVRLLISARAEIPVTWGTLRPCILLPFGAADWPEDRLRMVLMHELAHVKRGDFILLILALSVRALHWFNPLAWRAVSAMKEWAEWACDDVVLRQGIRASEYAEGLMAVCRSTSTQREVHTMGIAMAEMSRLERRMQVLLAPNRNRGMVSGGALAAILVIGAIVAGGLAILLPVAASATAESSFVIVPDAGTMDSALKQTWASQGITSEEQIREKLRDVVMERLDARFAKAGFRGVVLAKVSDGGIQVHASAAKEAERVKNLALSPVALRFHRIADHDATVNALKAVDANPQFANRLIPLLDKPAKGGASLFYFAPDKREAVRAVVQEINQASGLLPEGKILACSRKLQPPEEKYVLYLMDRQAGMDNLGPFRAMARPDENNPGSNYILFAFSEADAQRFGALTGQMIGSALGIVIDGEVVSAPVVRDRVSQSGQISGNFTAQEAHDLAAALSSGELPAQINIKN